MDAVYWLGAPGCDQEELVGGKAASLSRLASLHRVPDGFAIPALSPSHPGLIDELWPSISEAYRELAARSGMSDPPVAVRSSAIDEDGVGSSFAGQHETFLNVRGLDALLTAVEGCVQSAVSAQALAYRRLRELSVEDTRIAVLVQQLVSSDVSAVVFSSNPVSGDRDEVMINSNWGLGESIVGGTATPDTFLVSKRDLAIQWRQIAPKRSMTQMTEGGTEEVDVPETLQLAPSLQDSDVVRIAELALSLEGAVGLPVDVECAIAAGELYLLQCRPITTLS
jgi:pyruvate,water dikinase